MKRALIAAPVLYAVTVMMSAATASAQMVTPSEPPAKGAAAGKAGAKADAPGKAAKRDPAEIQKTIDQGVAALKAGKADNAVQVLSNVLAGGNLPPQMMAKTLYWRGVAFRTAGKPAQAIADLTSALWLKGGLNDAERADATQNRVAAYREAGLSDQADTVAAAPEPSSQPASKAGPGTTATATKTGGWQASSREGASGGGQTAALSIAPAEAPKSPSTSSGGIGSFFNNLFGGGSTASAEPTPPPQKVASAPSSAASAWSSATEVKRSAAPAASPARPTSPIATASVPPPPSPPPVIVAPQPAPQAQDKGRYLLQVAAVRSRAEADTVVAKLKKLPGAGLRQAMIDEAVVGNFGTLYRVRLGPFAEAGETRTLCADLRKSGLDCLMVAP